MYINKTKQLTKPKIIHNVKVIIKNHRNLDQNRITQKL